MISVGLLTVFADKGTCFSLMLCCFAYFSSASTKIFPNVTGLSSFAINERKSSKEASKRMSFKSRKLH